MSHREHRGHGEERNPEAKSENREPKIQNRAGLRPAFSLAEMMVAIGILGIGLTMVAMFFPVAMSQHSDTTIQQRAMEIAERAKSQVLSAPIRPKVPPPDDPNSLVWKLITQDEAGAPAYSPLVNWRTMVSPALDPNALGLLVPGTEAYLSAYAIDFAREARYVWYLFGRPAGGVTQYMIAVCRVAPGQRFVNFYDYSNPSLVQVFPFPWPFGGGWAVPLALPMVAPTAPYVPKRLLLSPFVQPLAPFNSGALASLVPPGSKIVSKKTGLVYTVLDVDLAANPDALDLREELAMEDVQLAPTPSYTFFPPPVSGAQIWATVNSGAVQYGDRSPLVTVLYF